jgi:DNA primase
MVHPEKQIWHCFGCGKGGDVFSFLQEMEGLDFPEALKLLAERAGVKLDTFVSEIKQSQRNRLFEITKKAAYFFHHFLLEIPTSLPAREYLKNRGLKEETIREWQIGYSSDQWDLLTKYLLKHSFAIDDIVASGLVIKREGEGNRSTSFYDRFRGRVMFPIADVHGNVVGFTGRVLVETEHSGGKYVNTPQTLLYDKSHVVYGLYAAKKTIKAKDQVVLVEGQMDVLSCHEGGMKHVVAASGTALTIEQIRLLKRYTSNVVIAFDADSAGENAGKRGIEVALAEGMHVKIAQIPEGFGKDADECIRKNKEGWFKVVQEAVDIMEWYFSNTFKKVDYKNPQNKQEASQVLLQQIARLPYAVEQEHWLKKLSEGLEVDMGVLREELKKAKKEFSRNSTVAQVARPVIEKKVELPTDRYSMLLQAFWALMLKFPIVYKNIESILRKEYFDSTRFSALYDLWCMYYNTPKFSVDEVRFAYIQQNSDNFVDILLLQAEKDYAELTTKEAEEELKKLWQHIHTEWSRLARKQAQVSLKEAEKNNDQARVAELLQKLQIL